MMTGTSSVSWTIRVPLITVSLLVLVACQDRAAATDGVLMMPDGTTRSHGYHDYRGQRVFINYWAEWCTPCRAEIPELNELAEDPDAVVLGRNFDDLAGEELKALIGKMQIRFPNLLSDPAERFGQRIPSVLPTTFVLDTQGELVAVLTGPQTVESLREAGAPLSD